MKKLLISWLEPNNYDDNGEILTNLNHFQINIFKI